MILSEKKKEIITLPYPYYFVTIAIIAIIGLLDSVYLAISHYRVYTDMGYQSFCAISRAFNCDTVSQSPYSVFMNVPVAIWGIYGYVFFIWLLAWAIPENEPKRRIWTLLFLLSLFFSIYSLFLAVISTYYIHSYCLMCILGYAVNLMLLYFTWLVRKRFQCESVLKSVGLDFQHLVKRPRIFISSILFFSSLALCLIFFMPTYWQLEPPQLSKEVKTGTTHDGHPWIGAEMPELVIEEFSDYRCFQCKKMHYFLRRLIQSNPDKIRLIHRHFPMDHTINPIVKKPFYMGSAKLAIVSLFAAEHGKFWEMNDVLFNISRQAEAINIKDLAQQAGIGYDNIKYVFQDAGLWKKLKKDIKEGLEYGLTGTPGFVINGEVYLGQIPAEILLK